MMNRYGKFGNLILSLQLDIVTVIVKFWTGRISDHDVKLFLKRYGELLQPPIKPVEKYGIWYGVRTYKVRLHRDLNGFLKVMPNSISLGPYNGRIIYPVQVPRCFICQAEDHQVKDCPTISKMKDIKPLFQTDIELWEALKNRVKEFFKFKCRILNQIKNVSYDN
uniref:Uncharacterized protein n=1 Tax=Oryzias melastigma TaxID=30732 RepID=A0A3B3E085_ORYME